jgi:hypothetical protein
MTRMCLTALLLLAGFANNAFGQVTAGAAFIFARETAPAYMGSDFSPPPAGVTTGVTVFGGTAITRKIGLQGELSIPRSISVTRKYRILAGDFTDTTVHRDILVSGLLRFRNSRSCCELLVGAGLVLARTLGTSVEVVRFPYNGPPVSIATKHLPRSPRLALTVGGDFPIRLNRRVSILPTVRVHWLSRYSEPPNSYNSPIELGHVALRAGIGARVDF